MSAVHRPSIARRWLAIGTRLGTGFRVLSRSAPLVLPAVAAAVVSAAVLLAAGPSAASAGLSDGPRCGVVAAGAAGTAGREQPGTTGKTRPGDFTSVDITPGAG